MWKQKFIKLQSTGDKTKEEKFEGWEEDVVGPDNFKVISKIGSGSFG